MIGNCGKRFWRPRPRRFPCLSGHASMLRGSQSTTPMAASGTTAIRPMSRLRKRWSFGYAPQDVSVLTFGTGWINGDNFERANGVPTGWHGLDWAKNAPRLLTGDTSRAQSLDISEGFGDHQIDFRRFQFALETDISGDAYSDDATYVLMKKLGDALGERIRLDQFAPNADARYDPEGLYTSQMKYRAAKETGKSHRSK